MAAHKRISSVYGFTSVNCGCEALQYSVWQSDWRVGRAGGVQFYLRHKSVERCVSVEEWGKRYQSIRGSKITSYMYTLFFFFCFLWYRFPRQLMRGFGAQMKV